MAVEQESSRLKSGKPLTIVDIDKKTNLGSINYDAIDHLLMQPDVKDRKVIVVSVLGSEKNKKSILDYCLKFLYANVSLNLEFCDKL